MNAAPEPGWYIEPSNQSFERYWDGASWSGSLRPRAAVNNPQPATVADKPAALSAVALVLAVLYPLVGAILGHIAYSQHMRATGTQDKLALGAIIVGWSFTALSMLFVLFLILLGFSGSF